MTKKLLFSLALCAVMTTIFVGCAEKKDAKKAKPVREYNAMILSTASRQLNSTYSAIIRGNYDLVRHLCGDTPHDRSFLSVAFSAATEDQNDPAVFRKASRASQEILKRIGRVGIINVDRKIHPAVKPYPLKSAANIRKKRKRIFYLLR